MNPIIRTALTAAIILPLASCGLFSGKHHPKTKTHTTARTVQPVRISNIDRTQGSQELMLHSMGLIGTPYRWGGSSTATGFDCSGMIQFVYKNALDVSLPRTARDMAAASRKIPDNQLKAGDLVFFNTGGSSQYSHVGLYIGNGEFIHAPSSGKTIKTEKLSSPYYAKHYLGAHTFFTE
ncbi:NlpC/P60 family protein [Neisseria sicca ATCC 29256]|uniref:NlpC/P60 family protein n=1 Tax=Neisseria sicca ATCC 29256 TaxID=547045 RepID=C6M827_NEISI|nr:C40 family peptidase [Neisseria sicca]EET43604.1 NlpC/P60 family protein [Neisseria sicca ATCC 29256]QMT39139.1 C40 family peptidase [Neisseria sicca]